MIKNLNYNSPREVREAGLKALTDALGSLGMVRFMQQFEDGHGDFTKEKYDRPDVTFEFEEVEEKLKAIGILEAK